MKKKIGIITFHRAHNYGAMLQVYALQKTLEKYDTVVIDYRNKEIEDTYKVLRINKRNIFTRIKSMVASVIYYKRLSKRHKSFDEFLKENIKLSKSYYTEDELKKLPPKLDIYITGSDQVWNYDIAAKKIDAYTLNFGEKNVKRISYAASMGKNSLDSDHEEMYIKNIKKLDAISVREKKAKEFLSTFINKEIVVTLDPTLLLKASQWEELLQLRNIEKEKYIFAYILTEDPEYYRIVKYLSSMTGLKIIHVSKRNKGIKNILRNAYADGPIEFLKLIKNAEYVIATSFHATVFSIIFHKKFWVIPPKKTSARITDLLEMLNIRERAVSTLEDLEKKNYDNPINYESVDQIIEKERKKSINWLENKINN